MSTALVLGLDSSTQSLSAVVLDAATGARVAEHAIQYRHDPRLASFGLDPATMVLPPREEGQAEQPAMLFVASMEALFQDLKDRGIDLSRIRAINTSAQQHGHVYLSLEASEVLGRLSAAPATTGSSPSAGSSLAGLLEGLLSRPGAPIWKSSNTSAEAAHLRNAAGGKLAMISLTGSDSPLRFSGAVMRRVAVREPEAWKRTSRVLLINAFINALLTGSVDQAHDYGNASGTSLMDYRQRSWSPLLLDALAEGIPGGRAAVEAKLGPVCHPLDSMGGPAPWWCARFGLRPDCRILAGSGDNPQTKVLFGGDLLSLGTSFVYMSSADQDLRDRTGAANAMYDGLGRPFQFACRTNGALVWDRIRSLHGLDSRDFSTSEKALAQWLPGSALAFWQPDRESFPLSGAFDLQRRGPKAEESFGHDYAGLVDSTLALLWHYSRPFSSPSDQPLYLTGGPSSSPAIAARVASLWQRPVKVIGGAGAALGAAVAAAVGTVAEADRPALLARLCAEVLGNSPLVPPVPALVSAWHGKAPGGMSTVDIVADHFSLICPA